MHLVGVHVVFGNFCLSIPWFHVSSCGNPFSALHFFGVHVVLGHFCLSFNYRQLEGMIVIVCVKIKLSQAEMD